MARSNKSKAPRRFNDRYSYDLEWMNHSRVLGHRKNKLIRNRAERRTGKKQAGYGRMVRIEPKDEAD